MKLLGIHFSIYLGMTIIRLTIRYNSDRLSFFSVFLSTLFKEILTWSSSLLPVPSKPPNQWWHLPGGQLRSSSKRCWKWRRRKAWRRPTWPPIHRAWRCHEMSGLILVSRWMPWCFMMFHDVSWRFMMFHDVSWCFSFMMFPRWLWQDLFRRRKTSWKFKEDSKKQFPKLFFWFFCRFQFCRFQPQEKPGTYLQERRNSRRWQRLSNLKNQWRRNEDKTNPNE